MIQNKLKNCCSACIHRKVYTEDVVLHANDSIYDFITKIGCEHEEICKEYIEEPAEEVLFTKRKMNWFQ